jgi:hypothetical protein
MGSRNHAKSMIKILRKQKTMGLLIVITTHSISLYCWDIRALEKTGNEEGKSEVVICI